MDITESFRKWWCVWIRHTRKNSHLAYFFKGLLRCYVPRFFTQQRLRSKLRRFDTLPSAQQSRILERVDYYCKLNEEVPMGTKTMALADFTYSNRKANPWGYTHSTYFLDTYEYTRYFSDDKRIALTSGDVNWVIDEPCFCKSRPVASDGSNANNILLNMDKVRHFVWVHDPIEWERKECKILFRGDARNKPRRLRFIEMWKDHPWCDLISTGAMSLYDHLYYKYIMALEGNDVASNLKWVMSSNSIAVMPRPTCETWYMEGRLVADYHYIEIADDYHDLIEKIEYYEAHPDDAKEIIRHAHEWVEQFRNQDTEDLVSLMVVDKYFRITGQDVV